MAKINKQKDRKQQMLVRRWENPAPHAWQVGMSVVQTLWKTAFSSC